MLKGRCSSKGQGTSWVDTIFFRNLYQVKWRNLWS